MWHFGLWTLGGDRIGEVLNATERKVSLPLSSVPTASFQIKLTNPMASEITGRDGDVLLTVHRGSTLWFCGDCTTAEEVGGEGGTTLACNFAGPLWRLQKRLCGKTGAPGLTFTATARGAIAQSLIDTTNTERDTGIRVGTIASLNPTGAGPWYHKPVAEAYSEMASSKVYPFEDITSGAAIVETFTTNLNQQLLGRAIETPNTQTWAEAGRAGSQYYVSPITPTDPFVGRAAVSDTVDVGSWAIAGTNTYGAIMAQVDFNRQFNHLDQPQGVFARYADTNNWVMGRFEASGSSTTLIQVQMRVAGTFSPLGLVRTAAITEGEVQTMRLHVEADGSWYLWRFPTGEISYFPILSGQDDALSSTGALATGRVGFYDEHFIAAASMRTYDNFYAKVPTVAMTLQGFEYELVPSVPTVDGSGVKVATLNVSARIGTDKPNAIFEYGAGNRSAKSYQRIIDRNSLLTQGYTLTDTDVRVSTDTPAIATRGLFEEVVPNDLGDAGLRQALTDAHVIVRRQAKQTVSFAPSTTAPVFGTDYIVGDTVRARVTANGVVRLEGTVRVYGVEISIDPEGKEDINPILVSE